MAGRRLCYSRLSLLEFWSDSLPLPAAVAAAVKEAGVPVADADCQQILTKRRSAWLRPGTRVNDEPGLSGKMDEIVQRYGMLDKCLLGLVNDSLSEWSWLIRMNLAALVRDNSFQPTSALWTEVCKSAPASLHPGSKGLQSLAQQCRQFFTTPMARRPQGASSIAANFFPAAQQEEMRRQEYEEKMMELRDCLVFMGHLFTRNLLSVAAYWCIFSISLCHLSASGGDSVMDSSRLGVQCAVEELIATVRRARHIVAYFGAQDSSLRSLIEDTRLTRWSELISRYLLGAVSNRSFEPKSASWLEACKALSLRQNSTAIMKLAQMCREIFTKPLDDQIASVKASLEARMQLRDCIFAVHLQRWSICFYDAGLKNNNTLEIICSFIGCLYSHPFNSRQAILSTKTCQCMAEVVLWMLRSHNDGGQEEWQLELQESLEDMMGNVRGNLMQLYGEGEQSMTEVERRAMDPWEAAMSKDTFIFYENQDLLSGYIKRHMAKKVNIFLASFKDQLGAHIDEARESSSFRVLSLGCGPGSDLLAVLEVWAEDAKRAGGDLECVGVDRQWWPKGAFLEKCSALMNASQLMNRNPLMNRNLLMNRNVTAEAMGEEAGRFRASPKVAFVLEDMEKFVETARPATFNIVVMSFVGAGKQGDDFFESRLPRLLCDGGAILMVDNYVSGVLELTKAGYQPTAVWLSSGAGRLETPSVPSRQVGAAAGGDRSGEGADGAAGAAGEGAAGADGAAGEGAAGADGAAGAAGEGAAGADGATGEGADGAAQERAAGQNEAEQGAAIDGATIGDGSARKMAAAADLPKLNATCLFPAKLCLVYRKSSIEVANTGQLPGGEFRVFYSSNEARSFTVHGSNMPDLMRLDAFIFAAQAWHSSQGFAQRKTSTRELEAIAKFTEEKFNAKYVYSTWTCGIVETEAVPENSTEAMKYTYFCLSSGPPGLGLLLLGQELEQSQRPADPTIRLLELPAG